MGVAACDTMQKEKEDLEAWAWFEPKSDCNNKAKLDSHVLHNIDEETALKIWNSKIVSAAMDDGLILNLATDGSLQAKASGGKKGGRWTDRYVLHEIQTHYFLPLDQAKSKAHSEAQSENR